METNIEWRRWEEEDISSYRDYLKEERRYWDAKKKALSYISEEVPLEEAMDRRKTD